MKLSEFYPATGKIVAVHAFDGFEQAEIDAFKNPDMGYLEEESDPDTQYVSGGALAARPIQSTSVSGTNLINLPIPAWVIIGDDRYEVTDGTAELSFPIPGTYQVLVQAFPYKDWEGEIAA